MFDFRGFVADVIGLVNTLLWIYMWIIIVRALISWVNPNPYNPAVRFLYGVTEPVLQAVRYRIARLTWSTGIDFSPLIVIIVIMIIRAFLSRILLI